MHATDLVKLLQFTPFLLDLEVDASLAFEYKLLFRSLVCGPGLPDAMLPHLTTLTVYVANSDGGRLNPFPRKAWAW
jgi:hypothetical protein